MFHVKLIRIVGTAATHSAFAKQSRASGVPWKHDDGNGVRCRELNTPVRAPVVLCSRREGQCRWSPCLEQRPLQALRAVRSA